MRMVLTLRDRYGWPQDLTDEQLIAKLVALNAERAAEEKRGLIRWLRPEFQNPAGATPQQVEADLDEDAEEAPTKATKDAGPAWPKTDAERIAAVIATLQEEGAMEVGALARRVGAKKVEAVREILEGLEDMGALVGVGRGVGRKWRVAGRRAA